MVFLFWTNYSTNRKRWFRRYSSDSRMWYMWRVPYGSYLFYKVITGGGGTGYVEGDGSRPEKCSTSSFSNFCQLLMTRSVYRIFSHVLMISWFCSATVTIVKNRWKVKKTFQDTLKLYRGQPGNQNVNIQNTFSVYTMNKFFEFREKFISGRKLNHANEDNMWEKNWTIENFKLCLNRTEDNESFQKINFSYMNSENQSWFLVFYFLIIIQGVPHT